jgi:acyl-CoA thioesterase FadM
MNLWLRLVRVLIAAFFRPRIGVLEPSVLHFRVAPTDLDLNIHMNNARYLAVMDLGRLDLMIRAGLLRKVLARRWQPVLGGAAIRFRRALRPFQRFTVTTQLVGWDERRFYMEQRIDTREGLAAYAYCSGVFVERGVAVASARVVTQYGYRGKAPTLPAWVEAWRSLDTTLSALPATEGAATPESRAETSKRAEAEG